MVAKVDITPVNPPDGGIGNVDTCSIAARRAVIFQSVDSSWCGAVSLLYNFLVIHETLVRRLVVDLCRCTASCC
ncbi:hypothetical protein ACFRDV_40575 [Streptomyces fagopyri]|uniref:hypothetical protein n=1 Tax=Streptomyces fagopyri TaxID=2662397 RepID=UPI00367EAC57